MEIVEANGRRIQEAITRGGVPHTLRLKKKYPPSSPLRGATGNGRNPAKLRQKCAFLLKTVEKRLLNAILSDSATLWAFFSTFSTSRKFQKNPTDSQKDRPFFGASRIAPCSSAKRPKREFLRRRIRTDTKADVPTVKSEIPTTRVH